MRDDVVKSGSVGKIAAGNDPKGDALHISFGKPQEADDSDVTDEGVIARLREGKTVGSTILNAGKRVPQLMNKIKAKA